MAAMAKAVDEEMAKTNRGKESIIILPRINEQPENILDVLAWQQHVDFYEPITLTIDQKRELVQNSLDWHTRKGTPSVVEEMIRTIFSEAHIEEWFEYGGRHHRFRIILDITNAKAPVDFALIIQMAMFYKRESAHLDDIIAKEELWINDYYGTATSKYIREYHIEEGELFTDVTDYHAGATSKYIRRYHIEEADIPTDTTDYHAGATAEYIRRYHIESMEIPADTTDYHAAVATEYIRGYYIESMDMPTGTTDYHAGATSEYTRGYHTCLPDRRVEGADIPTDTTDYHAMAIAGMYIHEHEGREITYDEFESADDGR
jgi:phage tail P2-like protein